MTNKNSKLLQAFRKHCEFTGAVQVDTTRYFEFESIILKALAQKEEEVLERVEEIAQGEIENSYKQFRGLFAQGYKLAASSIKERINQLKNDTD